MEKLNDGVADKDLIKFLSCQDLTSICTIEQAEKLIECMDHKALEISKKLEARKRDEYSIYRRRNDESLRCEVAYDKDKLDYLQLALDKLSFANNAYYDRPIKSCLFEDEVHFNNLHFLLLHGSKSLAEEKKLIRETKKGKQKGPVGSCSTLGMLNASIWGLICQSYHCSYSIDEVQYRKIIEEMNQLKCIREKAIANAAVKGRIWNSLGSKETIQDEVKESKIELTGKLDRLREKGLAVRAKFKKSEESLEAIQKDINSLREKLMEANRIKRRANRCLLKLTKEQD